MDKCPVTGLPCPHKKCIHVTEVANFQATQDNHMCVQCGLPYMAKEGGPHFNPAAQSVYQVINTLIKDPNTQEGHIALQPVEPPKPIGCPKCGHTVEDILMTGKLGCNECYTHYKKDLLSLIEKCQSGGVKHVGKVPKVHGLEEKLKKAYAKEPTPSKDLKTLETELKAAIKIEDYETAAKLRDEIKKLNSQ